MPIPQPPGKQPAAFYSGETYSIDESAGCLQRLVVASFSRNIDAELKELGLTAFQWAPVLMISCGKAGTAVELARVLDTDTGAITRMADRLEAKGLLQRQRCTEDRRVARLSLTATGEQVAKEIPACLSRVLNRHLQGFNKIEFEALKGCLQRMLENGGRTS